MLGRRRLLLISVLFLKNKCYLIFFLKNDLSYNDLTFIIFTIFDTYLLILKEMETEKIIERENNELIVQTQVPSNPNKDLPVKKKRQRYYKKKGGGDAKGGGAKGGGAKGGGDPNNGNNGPKDFQKVVF